MKVHKAGKYSQKEAENIHKTTRENERFQQKSARIEPWKGPGNQFTLRRKPTKTNGQDLEGKLAKFNEIGVKRIA